MWKGCVVEILSVLSLCVKSCRLINFGFRWWLCSCSWLLALNPGLIRVWLLLVALGFESWPDSCLALARGSRLRILAWFASGSRYLDKIYCVIIGYSGISYNNPTYFRIFCVIIGYSRISYNNTKYSEKCWVIIGYFDFSQCHALCLIKVFRWHILPNIDVRYSENASCQTFM